MSWEKYGEEKSELEKLKIEKEIRDKKDHEERIIRETKEAAEKKEAAKAKNEADKVISDADKAAKKATAGKWWKDHAYSGLIEACLFAQGTGMKSVIVSNDNGTKKEEETKGAGKPWITSRERANSRPWVYKKKREESSCFNTAGAFWEDCKRTGRSGS